MLRIVFVVAFLVVEPVPCGAEWKFMPPDAPAGGEASLAFVDGTSFEDVWAVGIWQPEGWRCLAEHFDGSSWTQFPTPDDPDNGGGLRGVVAISPGHAVAVGTHTPAGTTPQPLAMEWNGAEWELVATPEREGGRVFGAVDHTPTGQTWVAGHQSGSAFLARRDGENWELIFAPPVGSFRNRFYAMHARSDSEIWVVGTQSDGFGEFEILLQRYDGGSNWTSFNVPSPGTLDEMKGVVAFAADDAWAVGFYYHIPLYLYQPLILHYDGAGWTAMDLPDYPDGSARLEGMAASAPDDIYAAGTYATIDGTPRPLMLHFDGSSWSEVVLPPTGGSGEWFQGMSAAPDGSIWAVGQYDDGTSTEPMAFFHPEEAASVDSSPRPPFALRVVPNPFRLGTSTSFSLDRPGPVRLQVWDASGRLVRTLVETEMEAGPHAVPWNGLDSHGRPVAAGLYLYGLDTEGGTVRGKMSRVP
jgi:photosystem II stability/assembly factor-like uncharacterized protein